MIDGIYFTKSHSMSSINRDSIILCGLGFVYTYAFSFVNVYLSILIQHASFDKCIPKRHQLVSLNLLYQ